MLARNLNASSWSIWPMRWPGTMFWPTSASMVDRNAGDRRAHFEALDDAAQQLQAQGEALDGLLGLRELVAAEHFFLPDALLQQLPFAVEGARSSRVDLEHFLRDTCRPLPGAVALVAVLDLEDLVIEIEQRVLELQAALRALELGVALDVEVLEEPGLGLDGAALQVRVGSRRIRSPFAIGWPPSTRISSTRPPSWTSR